MKIEQGGFSEKDVALEKNITLETNREKNTLLIIMGSAMDRYPEKSPEYRMAKEIWDAL